MKPYNDKKTLFNSIIKEPSEPRKLKGEVIHGTVYTAFRESDRSIKLGFTRSLPEAEINESENGYIMIENRVGSIIENNVLKATLIELGYSSVREGNYYYISESLIKYLNILGWPIGNLYKITGKSKSTR